MRRKSGTLIAVVASGLLWAFTNTASAQLQAFDGEGPRMLTRVFFWKGESSPGQFSIDYSQPEWKAEYDAGFEAMTKGKRIRIGKDFWTTLDTNVPLTIGGKDVAPGHYFVALERSNDDKWNLVLLDPKAVNAKKLDAFQSDQTTGGTLVPLTYETSATSADKLSFKLSKGDLDATKCKLVLSWGKHKLSAAIVANLQST